jgi:glycine/D-amino acid oxidase-like deaminating enzyme
MDFMNDKPVWDDGNWEPLLPLIGGVEADVCVIGLGGSGLAAIHELLALGKTVVGLDAGAVGGGAAGRNGGFLLAGLPNFYHHAVEAIGRARAREIYRSTMLQLERMAEETPHAIRRTGSLRIAADDRELADCAEQVTVMRADGFAAEAYDGPEGRGVLVPGDGAFNPLQRCRSLARSAIGRGARLFEGCAAEVVSGESVTTSYGDVHCKHVIVAVDGQLERVVPELSHRTRTARLQMLATAPDSAVTFPRPVYYRWGYEYWQQLPDGRVALGGLRDRAGDAEWTSRAAVTDVVQLGLEEILRDRLHVTAPITHRWVGLVGYTYDMLPVVEQVRPNLWAIGGYCGTGNVLGALCGRGVAQTIVNGTSPMIAPLIGTG